MIAADDPSEDWGFDPSYDQAEDAPATWECPRCWHENDRADLDCVKCGERNER